MLGIDGWDWALLVVAGYVAVLSLVRLMRTHHDVVLNQWQEQIRQEGTRQEGLRRSQRRSDATSRSATSDSAERGKKTEAA